MYRSAARELDPWLTWVVFETANLTEDIASVMKKQVVLIGSILILGAPIAVPTVAQTASPRPATDIPEEVLQTEVITSGRSPIDNRPLTATEYAELKTEIDRTNQTPPKLSNKLRNTMALLKLRKFVKTMLPFIPIK
jgi:hypothetical protein